MFTFRYFLTKLFAKRFFPKAGYTVTAGLGEEVEISPRTIQVVSARGALEILSRVTQAISAREILEASPRVSIKV